MKKEFNQGDIINIKFQSKVGIAGQVELLKIEYTEPFEHYYFKEELQHQSIGYATIKYINTKTYNNKVFKCRIVEYYTDGIIARCQGIILEQKNYRSIFLNYEEV